ncbi:MAG TPA: penicillin-binding protein 1A, partial [Aurantimonas coralicida]|nr:penicillin-binding protein 1A [Aurantimonas coralicida]
KVTGGSLPAQAWHDFMTAAHEGLPAVPLPGDYRIGEAEAPLTADSGYGEDRYYDSEMPAGEDQYYNQAGAPLPPADVGGQGVVIYDGPPPPGVTVEGRVNPGRASDSSLFRRLFGG